MGVFLSVHVHVCVCVVLMTPLKTVPDCCDVMSESLGGGALVL